MAWTLKANLRGPRGVRGVIGPQGLPGAETLPTDDAVAVYVASASATKAALGQFISGHSAATTTVDFKTTAGGVRYSVARVHTHGKFLPGLVSKEFALDYQDEGTTGEAFIPIREDLDAAQLRLGASAIFSSSGWFVSGNIGEIVGAQIRNGIAYHDQRDSADGSDSLGFFADGTSRVFSFHTYGDTTATMLAAGVVNSFSYGPGLVRAGVALDFMADSYWAPKYQGPISARQILGQSLTGDIIVISIEGQTDVAGLGGNDLTDLAVAEGCHNAILLDGGGSAQSVVNGIYTQPSSDSIRKRPAPDFIVLNTRGSSRSFDTGWIPLVLETGYEANGEAPAIRQKGLDIEFRGQVKPTTGSFGNTTVTVAKIPARFKFTGTGKVFMGNGPSLSMRKVIAQSNGNLDIAADTTDVAYVTLYSVRYSVD